jgi:hypothetical protein
VNIFGEWERLPVGGVTPPPGDYEAEFVLTEESFHGGGLAGGWAAAVGSMVTFTLVALPGDFDGDRDVDLDDLDAFERCVTGPAVAYEPGALGPNCDLVADADGIISADLDRDGDVDQSDFGTVQLHIGQIDSPTAPYCPD